MSDTKLHLSELDQHLTSHIICPTCGKNAANAHIATSGLYGESMAKRYCCFEYLADRRFRLLAEAGIQND